MQSPGCVLDHLPCKFLHARSRPCTESVAHDRQKQGLRHEQEPIPHQTLKHPFLAPQYWRTSLPPGDHTRLLQHLHGRAISCLVRI